MDFEYAFARAGGLLTVIYTPLRREPDGAAKHSGRSLTDCCEISDILQPD